jgi:gluconate 2-dehydrogenase gamma chain
MLDEMTIDRRAMMAQIAALIGAAAIPADAYAAAAKGQRKRFLSPAQYALFSAIADTIIPVTDTPGALAAAVPARFDGLLGKWASATRKTQLTGALSDIDAAAMTSDKKGFAALTPSRRKALLTEYDKAAVKPGAPPKEKLNALQAMMAGPPVANPAYVKLKELVILIYYSSEIAMTKELVYEHVPGAFVPSLKITPGMRPYAGLGGPF